jgi:hypothetical protein
VSRVREPLAEVPSGQLPCSPYLSEEACASRLERYVARLTNEFDDRIFCSPRRLDPRVKPDLHALPRSVRLEVIHRVTERWLERKGYKHRV